MNDLEKLGPIFGAFAVGEALAASTDQAGGLINANHHLTTESGAEFLLQGINGDVFPRPDLLMENILAVTVHLRSRGEPTLEYVPLKGDADGFLHRDESGHAWRLCRWVSGTVTRLQPQGPDDARAAGRAYGRFLKGLADFPAANLQGLHETLPGFHDTPSRWAALLQAFHDDPCGRAVSVQLEMEAFWNRADLGQGLVRLDLPVRVTHNDAKLANVLLDADTGAPRCVVDLDTVMPGTCLHDFGDMMRTMCCTAGEEETDLYDVAVDPALLAALADCWLAETEAVLAPVERIHLLPAGLIITFEQAARFLTDHLLGDVYYRTDRPDHNLDRCRNQLRLLESMVDSRAELAAVLP